MYSCYLLFIGLCYIFSLSFFSFLSCCSFFHILFSNSSFPITFLFVCGCCSVMQAFLSSCIFLYLCFPVGDKTTDGATRSLVAWTITSPSFSSLPVTRLWTHIALFDAPLLHCLYRSQGLLYSWFLPQRSSRI